MENSSDAIKAETTRWVAVRQQIAMLTDKDATLLRFWNEVHSFNPNVKATAGNRCVPSGFFAKTRPEHFLVKLAYGGSGDLFDDLNAIGQLPLRESEAE